ncbi:hypothetical protein LZ31DRAFT_607775 [Colletotrichum somersetense]|nr:hypothetical protein LZ31DRAFT_607775 [Colletotrichum somersetense]
MKYLGNHFLASELLSAWAEPQVCTVASHCSWSAGTRLQKPIDRLLRSLIYEVFRQMLEMIDNIVPKETFQNDYCFQSFEDGRDWSILEWELIVNRLVDYDKLALRFCFFLDGMDK